MASPVNVNQNLGVYEAYASTLQDAINQNKQRTVVAGKYTVLDLDGDPKFPQQGLAAKICFCFSREVEGAPYLISIAKKGALSDSQTLAEKDMHKRLSQVDGIAHPHVIEQSGGFQYAIFDLFNQGALVDYLIDEKELKPWERDWIFYCVTKTVAKCHELNVVLRDLKVDDVLLRRLPDGSLDVKIADLGLFLYLPEAKQSYDRELIGSAECLPPEAFADPMEKYYRAPQASYKTDSWALGMVFYEMYVRETCLGEEDIQLFKTEKMKPEFPDFTLAEFGPYTNEVRALLSKVPVQRPYPSIVLEKIAAIFQKVYNGFPIPYKIPA